MNLKLLWVLFLPVAITEKVNNSQLTKYRKDFMKQLLDGIPFRLPTLNARKPSKSVKPTKNPLPMDQETVKYYLYNRQYPHHSILINNDLSAVNPKLPVKFLVHGWTEHYYVEWCKRVTEAYLRRGLYNVVVSDWSSKGDADYISASFAVPEVGQTMGDFVVKRLHQGRGIPLKRIHLVSHSMGAHVAALAGQRIRKLAGRAVGRITALDPAAPYFDFFTLQKDDRLSPDDASFVDIIHTDGGVLGFKQPIGTADFFPNGGTAVQPGCSLLKADVRYEDLFCSHAKSHVLFVRSITDKKVKATPCANWSKFDQGACGNNTEITFGEDVPRNINGSYFLRTSEKV